MDKTYGLSVTVGGGLLVTTAIFIFMCFAYISWSWLLKNEYPVLWHYFVPRFALKLDIRVSYVLNNN